MAGPSGSQFFENNIRESEPNGGSFEKIAEGGWWNAVDVDTGKPVNSSLGDFSSGVTPEAQFVVGGTGGPYGIQIGNSEDATLAWNFMLPLHYMAQQGASGYRRQTWILDLNAVASTTATALRARVRRVNSASAGTLGTAVTATGGDQTIAITGDTRYRYYWTNPAGSPRDMYQLNLLPVSALGVGDTLTIYGWTLYAKCHAAFADRALRSQYDNV